MNGVSYTVGKKKNKFQILERVSGIFKPGRMTALMGPSGSGKTTLLDIVAGRKNTGKIDGDILYGGVKPSKKVIRGALGYVEQFDTLVGELTVKQMLMYTACLRLPTTFTAAE